VGLWLTAVVSGLTKLVILRASQFLGDTGGLGTPPGVRAVLADLASALGFLLIDRAVHNSRVDGSANSAQIWRGRQAESRSNPNPRAALDWRSFTSLGVCLITPRWIEVMAKAVSANIRVYIFGTKELKRTP